jgi:hypothetical protein
MLKFNNILTRSFLFGHTMEFLAEDSEINYCIITAHSNVGWLNFFF